MGDGRQFWILDWICSFPNRDAVTTFTTHPTASDLEDRGQPSGNPLTSSDGPGHVSGALRSGHPLTSPTGRTRMVSTDGCSDQSVCLTLVTQTGKEYCNAITSEFREHSALEYKHDEVTPRRQSRLLDLLGVAICRSQALRATDVFRDDAFLRHPIVTEAAPHVGCSERLSTMPGHVAPAAQSRGALPLPRKEVRPFHNVLQRSFVRRSGGGSPNGPPSTGTIQGGITHNITQLHTSAGLDRVNSIRTGTGNTLSGVMVNDGSDKGERHDESREARSVARASV